MLTPASPFNPFFELTLADVDVMSGDFGTCSDPSVTSFYSFEELRASALASLNIPRRETYAFPKVGNKDYEVLKSGSALHFGRWTRQLGKGYRLPAGLLGVKLTKAFLAALVALEPLASPAAQVQCNEVALTKKTPMARTSYRVCGMAARQPAPASCPRLT